MVSLTGSPETGKWIAREAANNLKRVHLELGGKAPVVVFDDVDMETAMETIAGTGYYNAGQDCTAATRVLASKKVYDKVVSGLAEQAEGRRSATRRTATPRSGHSTRSVSSSASRASLSASPRLRRSSPAARKRAARFFMKPAVVAGLKQKDERMSQNEIFGPVITVQPFTSEEKAIEWANGTDTGSPPRSGPATSAGRCGSRRRSASAASGSTTTSRSLASEMPHGGYKQSGYGKDLSMYALEDYTNVKHVMASLSWSARLARMQ